MSKYNRVLIPLDCLAGISVLSPAVRRIVDTPDSEITLLHVVESQPWQGRSGHAARLMTELELFAHRQFRGAKITRRIEWGRPADCILSVIRSTRSQVVLMSAGDDPSGASVLGPVATEVLTQASCPVLLEWTAIRPWNTGRALPVCCAIEFDGGEEALVQEAACLADRLCASLRIIAVLPEPGTKSVRGLRDREARTAHARSRIESLCARWAPRAAVEIGVGEPASIVGRAVRLHGAGLLVTGGSLEAPLAAESQCAVLYVGPGVRQRISHLEEFAAGRTA